MHKAWAGPTFSFSSGSWEGGEAAGGRGGGANETGEGRIPLIGPAVAHSELTLRADCP